MWCGLLFVGVHLFIIDDVSVTLGMKKRDFFFLGVGMSIAGSY